MKTPAERLQEAKAEVARLERVIASKSCAEGHEWRSIGGCNAGCGENCHCSVPVNICAVCGDCDYGENEEAREIVDKCRRKRLDDGI